MNPFAQKKIFLEALQALRLQKKPKETATKTDASVCPSCKESFSKNALGKSLFVCPDCGHHFSISAQTRLDMLLDAKSVRFLNRRLQGGNPLNFPSYEAKLAALRSETGIYEAVVTAVGKIGGVKVVVCVLDSRFLMGSMGTAVGEKITRAVEYATHARLPIIIFSASGGARMQEGILSLFQMAKTAAALERHADAGLLYISFLTHPTTGGVTASFASLGDVILAEPRALIGFAGPRVIEQTIRQTLPDGFQRSEYLLEHGFVDAIIPRGEMREAISRLLALHGRTTA